jgi:hypothetical protein
MKESERESVAVNITGPVQLKCFSEMLTVECVGSSWKQLIQAFIQQCD